MIDLDTMILYLPALEALCSQKDEELESKQEHIVELQCKLKAMERRYERELMGVRLKTQQDAYVARYLGDQQDRRRTSRHQ